MPNSRNPFPRRAASKEKPDRILIVCEGQTEALYFLALKSKYRLSTVVVKCANGGFGKVVEEAIKEAEKASGDIDTKYDQIWCIFDREDQGKKVEFEKAFKLANERGFKLGISNPSFEYWFMLHIDKHASYLADGDKACKKLNELSRKRFGIDYDKDRQTLERFLPKLILDIEFAVARAKARLQEARQSSTEDYPNPCTTVFQLVEELIKLAENKPYR